MKKSISRIYSGIIFYILFMNISHGQVYYRIELVNEDVKCNKSLIELNNMIDSINSINLDSLNLKTVGDLIDYTSVYNKLNGITIVVRNDKNLFFTGLYLECELNNKYEMGVYICLEDKIYISGEDKNIIMSLTNSQYLYESQKENLNIFLKYYFKLKRIDNYSIFQSRVPKPMKVPNANIR